MIETSLYLIFFDTPVESRNRSSIIKKLKQFGATRIRKGAVDNPEDSIEFRIPNSFDPDQAWQSFLAESGCNIEMSCLPY